MWTISENKTWQHLESHYDWVADMQAVPQDARHHAEGNVALHTQLVLQALTEQAGYTALPAQQQEILWAAALLHDVEKRSTTVTERDGIITANGHARKGAGTARQILFKQIPTPFGIREQVVGLVRHHGLPLWLLEKHNPQKRLIMAAMEVDTSLLAILAKADAIGRICDDKADLLYRIDCFEEYCREHKCWGTTRVFANNHARMQYLLQEEGYAYYVPYDQPAMQVILMSGLPGAGKDTYIKKHFKHMPLISLDQLRSEMKIAPTDKEGNGQVIQAAKEQARVFLRNKTGFVWNATNTTLQMRSQLIELFMSYKAAVKIVYVEVPYQKMHKQNKNREANVPTNVLDKLINKLEVPALWEAHEVEYVISA